MGSARSVKTGLGDIKLQPRLSLRNNFQARGKGIVDRRRGIKRLKAAIMRGSTPGASNLIRL